MRKYTFITLMLLGFVSAALVGCNESEKPQDEFPIVALPSLTARKIDDKIQIEFKQLPKDLEVIAGQRVHFELELDFNGDTSGVPGLLIIEMTDPRGVVLHSVTLKCEKPIEGINHFVSDTPTNLPKLVGTIDCEIMMPGHSNLKGLVVQTLPEK